MLRDLVMPEDKHGAFAMVMVCLVFSSAAAAGCGVGSGASSCRQGLTGNAERETAQSAS